MTKYRKIPLVWSGIEGRHVLQRVERYQGGRKLYVTRLKNVKSFVIESQNSI